MRPVSAVPARKRLGVLPARPEEIEKIESFVFAGIQSVNEQELITLYNDLLETLRDTAPCAIVQIEDTVRQGRPVARQVSRKKGVAQTIALNVAAVKAATMWRNAGQLWLTTRRPQAAEPFRFAELIRLSRRDGQRIASYGTSPTTKAERSAMRHFHIAC
jgi:hypothetical protein